MGPRGTAPVRVKTTIFKGELIGLEPYDTLGDGQLSLRALDRLHRLTRGRKSMTYQSQSDQDIVNAVVQEHGLSAETGSTPTITHSHVYQHNQTDLEFILGRARTIGYRVWCEDTKLFFAAPKLDTDSGLDFVLGTQSQVGALRLTAFSARTSNAQVVRSVTVRGRNPETGQEIVGEATAGATSPLGSVPAATTLDSFGQVDTFTVRPSDLQRRGSEGDREIKARRAGVDLSHRRSRNARKRATQAWHRGQDRRQPGGRSRSIQRQVSGPWFYAPD